MWSPREQPALYVFYTFSLIKIIVSLRGECKYTVQLLARGSLILGQLAGEEEASRARRVPSSISELDGGLKRDNRLIRGVLYWVL